MDTGNSLCDRARRTPFFFESMNWEFGFRFGSFTSRSEHAEIAVRSSCSDLT